MVRKISSTMSPLPPEPAASFEDQLSSLDEKGLRRYLRSLQPGSQATGRLGNRDVVNFSSNDYLGLAQSEELKAAMIEGVQRYGAGSGASRLVCGNLPPHEALEDALARFKSTEAALAFSSGYATAMGVIPGLMEKGDIIILDKLSHASLIDASKLSGATLRVFPHNQVGRLEQLLQNSRRTAPSARVLVVTESVFSMDGDLAPLEKIVPLCEEHNALLLVDEAHAVGVLGPQGRGLVAALGLEKRVPLQMGTLSKALGVSGGYIAASRVVIELLINKARSLIYSTAPPPALAFAATAAIELVQGKEGEARRARLRANLEMMRGAFASEGAAGRASLLPQKAGHPSAILPLIVGDERRALDAAQALLECGYLIPAIRFPTVARGAARLRLTLSALHELAQVEGLIACLHRLMTQFAPTAPPALEEGEDQPLP